MYFNVGAFFSKACICCICTLELAFVSSKLYCSPQPQISGIISLCELLYVANEPAIKIFTGFCGSFQKHYHSIFHVPVAWQSLKEEPRTIAVAYNMQNA